MNIFTIGYTHKSAKEFFNLLLVNNIEIIVDIRLNNTSQLAGYTKKKDLEFFASSIGNISYLHYQQFAPTKELLTRYKKKQIAWDEYEKEFALIMQQRDCLRDFLSNVQGYTNICLLCSEEKADFCHRRLVADYVKDSRSDVQVKHL